MARFICETCGTQFDDQPTPPPACPICLDDRQYVGWEGQKWTTLDKIAITHRVRLDEDAGLLGIDIQPSFAIPQRALVLPTDVGNIMWESISLVTPEAVAALNALGGVAMIAISHPHFYSCMVEWSEALGGVPILLHENDKQWIMRDSPRIQFWSGDEHRLSRSVTLIRCGGHFPGSTALHWKDGPRPGGSLFPGDALQVVADRRHVTFMYSYPNFIPMSPRDVAAIRERMRDYSFEDVFGYSRGRNIIGGGREAVDRSFDRYFQAIAA